MTIFDSIKYPISIPPTKEELDALPTRLFNEWRKQAGFYQRATPREVSEWFSDGLDDTDLISIKTLNQMIKDYDNL